MITWKPNELACQSKTQSLAPIYEVSTKTPHQATNQLVIHNIKVSTQLTCNYTLEH
jgi:hypothetical protein